MSRSQIQQQDIPPELFGALVEFTGDLQDGAALRGRLDDDGYLLLRGVFGGQENAAARAEVFGRLERVGEVKSPAVDGIATGASRRHELEPDAHRFWKSVSEGQALRRVTHGPQLRDLMGVIFDEPARPHDLVYLRPAAVGRATRFHYDFPFFARRSRRIHTAWIPLGDTPLEDGPLVIVEGSNRFADLIDPIRDHDYQSDHANDTVQRAAYERPNETDPLTFVRQRQTRLLSADFRAGDLVVFGGFTLHGSLDNCSALGRVRLSCDVRFQPAADPFDDERYFGDDPRGSKGGGYGDMKGAKPLTEAW